MLGILQRYVIDQVARTFGLALVTITSIFVLFMVMAEATRQGLSPQDIFRAVPYIIPSSLPYTIPVALLFAVSVVYGRMASDNEIVAVKTAGISVIRVLMPTWTFGLALTAGLFWLSSDAIPRSTHNFKLLLFQDFEDALYKIIKKEGEFNRPAMPFYIAAKDVQDRKLIGAVFMHRTKEDANAFDLHVYADEATIHFDTPSGQILVDLTNAITTGGSEKPFIALVDGRKVLSYPMPKDQNYKLEKRVQEMTNTEMTAMQTHLLGLIRDERARQAIGATMKIGSGHLGHVNWVQVGLAYQDFAFWQKRWDELETEKHLRISLAAGSLFFVLLGAPVGILFARRDFLSAFITCFLPIIVVYYPLTLAGVNLAKEGNAIPAIVFAGNLALGVVSGFVIQKVRRH